MSKLLHRITGPYVEAFVTFFDNVGLAFPVRVPKWYAKAWNYPDNSWGDDPTRWETMGYHVGHVVTVVPWLVLGTVLALQVL